MSSMKVTLGTFKGIKGKISNKDVPFVVLIIDNYTVAMKCIPDIVGPVIVDLTLHPHGLYDNDKPIIDINTGKEVFNRLLKRLHAKEESVMNYMGGSGDLKNFPWEEISRVSKDYPYKTNLRDLLIKENEEYEIP